MPLQVQLKAHLYTNRWKHVRFYRFSWMHTFTGSVESTPLQVQLKAHLYRFSWKNTFTDSVERTPLLIQLKTHLYRFRSWKFEVSLTVDRNHTGCYHMMIPVDFAAKKQCFQLFYKVKLPSKEFDDANFNQWYWHTSIQRIITKIHIVKWTDRHHVFAGKLWQSRMLDEVARPDAKTKWRENRTDTRVISTSFGFRNYWQVYVTGTFSLFIFFMFPYFVYHIN